VDFAGAVGVKKTLALDGRERIEYLAIVRGRSFRLMAVSFFDVYLPLVKVGQGGEEMNIWLLLGAIVVLWVFAFSLMYLSFWLEERRERKREKKLAVRLAVDNVYRMEDYRREAR